MTTTVGPTTALLGKFFKQSNEILDYDVDFTDWFSNRTDTPATFAVLVDAGTPLIATTVLPSPITIVTSARIGNVVKVLLSGGTNGTRYKATVRLTSTAGLVKEVDFSVTVKDI